MRAIRVAVEYFGAKLDIAGSFDAIRGSVSPDCIHIGDQDVTDFYFAALNDDARRGIMAKASRAAHKQVYEGR